MPIPANRNAGKTGLGACPAVPHCMHRPRMASWTDRQLLHDEHPRDYDSPGGVKACPPAVRLPRAHGVVADPAGTGAMLASGVMVAVVTNEKAMNGRRAGALATRQGFPAVEVTAVKVTEETLALPARLRNAPGS